MRAVLLNANRAGIGTYHRALNFGRQLALRGAQATLFTTSRSEPLRIREREDPSGMTIVECPSVGDGLTPWRASGPLDVALRTSHLLTKRVDLVYAFEYQPNVSLPVYGSKLVRSYALISDWCDWHAGAAYRFRGWRVAHAIDRFWEERIRHVADHVTVINNVLATRALEIGVPVSRVSVVREGVDSDYISPRDSNEARRRLSLPEDALIVGTIRDQEDAFAILAESVRRVSGEIKELHLLFIGRPFPNMDALLARYGVSEETLCPGWVRDEDLPDYLASCDILALPQRDCLMNRGRWPHKLGDMLAAERPVITTMASEFAELVKGAGAALVVEYTAEAIGDALRTLSRDALARRALAKRGRAFARTELSWSNIGDSLAQIVSGVLSHQ